MSGRSSYSEETKKRIVRQVVVDGKSQNMAARDSGFQQALISGWVKKYGDEVKREAHQDEHDLEKAMADAAEEARARHKAMLQAETEKAREEQVLKSLAIQALMEEKPGRPAEDPLPVTIATEEPEPEPEPDPEPKPLDTSRYTRLEPKPAPQPEKPATTVRMKTTRAEGKLITMNLSQNGMVYISQQKAEYTTEQIPLLAAELMAGLAMLGTETETTI